MFDLSPQRGAKRTYSRHPLTCHARIQAGASWRRLSDRRSPPVACLAALRLDTSTARTTAAGAKAIGRRNCAYNRSPAGFIAMSEGATYSAVEVLSDKR